MPIQITYPPITYHVLNGGRPMASVTATIQYIQDDGDRAAYHASEAGGAAATHDGQFDPRQVQINDAQGVRLLDLTSMALVLHLSDRHLR